MKDYSNAYTEVYTILNCLAEEELNKIPEELLRVIADKRNVEYNYELNEELDLAKQPMLTETKALLFNFFRDYLSTPIQREKIKKMQQEDRIKDEEKKKQKYGEFNVFTKKTKNVRDTENKIDETHPVVIKNKNIFDKVKSIIKNYFR